MTTLHLMVGPPCSGKTTLARALEQKCSALRLTPDGWHVRLFGQDATDPQQHDVRHSLIEALQWSARQRGCRQPIAAQRRNAWWSDDS